jgi:hypothetical protein
MRSTEEYRAILELWEAGGTKKGIAQITGIPRGTVIDCIKRYGSLARLEEVDQEKAASGRKDEASAVNRICVGNPVLQRAYVYLLGLYLGDGYISLSKGHRVYRLRIALDKQYPNIIDACVGSIKILLPENRVDLVSGQGFYDVSCYYKFWPALFPQHGKGMKHERTIALESWQQKLVDAYPLEIFRGLYHSDGSRSANVVKGKNYPRYIFANESPGIRAIFCKACDALNLHWTIANRRNVCVSRREDVARLDDLIGPKC